MLWVDYAIVSLIGMYTIGGFMRGFSQALFSVIVWVFGIVIGWFFSTNFSGLLVKVAHTTTVRLAFAYISLIFITLLMGWIINLLLGDAIKKTGLGFFERLGGMLFGGVNGLLVAFALVMIAGLTPLPKDRWWQESKYISPFQSVAQLMKTNASSKLAKFINYPNPLINKVNK